MLLAEIEQAMRRRDVLGGIGALMGAAIAGIADDAEAGSVIHRARREFQRLNREDRCLVANAWHEARGDGMIAMIAVTRVVLSRMADPRWPDSACGVVFQPNQFSWTRGWRPGSMPRLKNRIEAQALLDAIEAVRRARAMGPWPGVFWYHATDINPPRWTRPLMKIAVIGKHIFYGDPAKVASNSDRIPKPKPATLT